MRWHLGNLLGAVIVAGLLWTGIRDFGETGPGYAKKLADEMCQTLATESGDQCVSSNASNEMQAFVITVHLRDGGMQQGVAYFKDGKFVRFGK